MKKPKAHPAINRLRDVGNWLSIQGKNFQNFAWRFSRNKGAVLAFAVISFVILVAVFAEHLAPYNPKALVARPFILPGSSPHWLGTDDLGRDNLSGVIHGARTSLIVGVVAAFMSFIVGVVVGAISGFYGGKLGIVLDRITELFIVIPQFFLAILLVSLFGSGLEKVIFVIGILSWPPIARIVRAEFLSLKELGFVEAARSLVFSNYQIIFSEILPNALPPVIVASSLQIARAILLEAGLSFLGLGDPQVISWGTMLQSAQQYLRDAGWITIWPGIAISITVLGFNLMGDGLNDAMNPRIGKR